MRFFTLICCFLVASVAMAKDFKVATVDLQQLFKEYPGTKKAQKKFNAMADEKKQKLTDEADEIRDIEKSLKDSGSVLSKKEMKAKQEEYATKAKAFQDEESQVQNDLAAKEQEMTKTLLEEIKGIVAKIAKNDGVDMVLDAEKTVYAKDAVDLTDEVLKSYKSSDSDSK